MFPLFEVMFSGHNFVIGWAQPITNLSPENITTNKGNILGKFQVIVMICYFERRACIQKKTVPEAADLAIKQSANSYFSLMQSVIFS